MIIWTITVWLSGLSYQVNSFYMLLFSRLLSGVAEASFYVVAPPLIESRGGANAGLWMSIFIGAFPLGVAMGMFYGALVAHHYHWSWCFYGIACASLPLVISIYFIHDNVNGGVLAPSTHTIPSCDGSEKSRKIHFTFVDEMFKCLTSRKLISIILADSVQTGEC